MEGPLIKGPTTTTEPLPFSVTIYVGPRTRLVHANAFCLTEVVLEQYEGSALPDVAADEGSCLSKKK